MDLSHLNTKLGRRLTLVFVIIISGVTVTLVSFYLGLKSSLIDVKKLHSRDLASTAVEIARHYYLLAESSSMSVEDAKEKSLNVIKDMKFSENGYYWVANGDGVMLMHPYSEKIVGKNLAKMKDAEGNFMYPNFIRVSKSGGGHIQYNWPKPAQQNTQLSKLSYVAYFNDWNWIIGTGIYIDDMEKSIREYAYKAIVFVIFFTLLFSITAMEFTRRIIDELRSKAIRDPLTSLYTRRYLNETMTDLELKLNRESDLVLAILFFDIDYFKSINDNYGHKLGDEVIAKVGEIMLRESRPDDLCIRYGGEEFVLITASKSRQTAELLVDRIRRSIVSEQFNGEDEVFSVTISVGIAYHSKEDSVEKTIDRADHFLYKAKEGGRNNAVFET